MNLDALIGKLVRYFNREMLRLPDRPRYTPLPGPDPSRRYLLYLHIPYCQVLCPFCSFHRVQFRDDVAARYFDCLRDEIDIVSDRGYVFDEAYFGGGTPTVLPGELDRTIERLKARHPVSRVSVETNPDDLGRGALEPLEDAGISRLSVGVQSFDDALLGEMDRYDRYGSGADIRKALEQAHGRFETLNVDMIFNFPHQSRESLERDLDILTRDLAVDQVSYYPLMNVDGPDRALEHAMGNVTYAREREFYELIVERMTAAGYTRNSAWCFSRRSGMVDEYIVDREEYLGLGSGAFSYLAGSLYASSFSIGEYRRYVESGRTGTVFRQELDDRDQKRYYLLMELFGGSLDKRAAEERFGGRFGSGLWRELSVLSMIGAIRDRGPTLTLTERGQYLIVVMMREFFAGVNRLREEMRHTLPQVSVAAPEGAADERTPD